MIVDFNTARAATVQMIEFMLNFPAVPGSKVVEWAQMQNNLIALNQFLVGAEQQAHQLKEKDKKSGS